ncbi:MAG TPA: hypothetical protein PKE63_13095 [Lacibacter sp.]|nr:hypothetical protein [Lacibacter sp.]HMO89046.1 hypothetical protein [Lacibacter sp.]HMP88209.1 hypothetical protein [Lacibacter sp.]
MPPPLPPDKKKYRSNASYLMQYSGLAMQLLAVLGITVYLGIKADGWLQLSFPLFAWLLPLLGLTGSWIRIFKDTEKKP